MMNELKVICYIWRNLEKKEMTHPSSHAADVVEAEHPGGPLSDPAAASAEV